MKYEDSSCDITVDSEQHSAHSSSLTAVLCSRPMAVRHQQERVSKMNFTLYEDCDMYWSLVLVVTGLTLQLGFIQKGIQHTAIQRVVFRQTDERMRETGNVLPTPALDSGRPHTRWTPAPEEMVLDMVAQNPCRSTWGIVRELGVEHCAVHFILQGEDYYSWIQGLMPHDYHLRLQCCEWLL
jgi:hypothetical protein